MQRELAAEDDGLIQQLEHTAICLVAGETQIWDFKTHYGSDLLPLGFLL